MTRAFATIATLVAAVLCGPTLFTAQQNGATATRAQGMPVFPRGARIVETRALSPEGYPDRMLVLWMSSAASHPFLAGPNEPYTCPDETRGSYVSGPTRVSVVDTDASRIVNTVEIRNADNADTLDLPLRIRPGRYYAAASTSSRAEGKPTIMKLADHTGEGRPLQFPLFDALACMPVVTTLIGYVPETDRVEQYAIKLSLTYRGRTTERTQFWLDYLFAKIPKAPGLWSYEVDYTGRGGSLDRTEVRFDGATRQSIATRTSSDVP